VSEIKELAWLAALTAGCLLFLAVLFSGCDYIDGGPRWSCEDRRFSVERNKADQVSCDHSKQKLTREGDDWLCRCAP
jgi:hypothetical protein